MTHFPLRNSHKNITLVCEIISVWKGRSRVILSKGEYPSQNENICTFEMVQMFGAATNTNKCIATGGPVLASGEHVTGGLVAARSLAAARGQLTAHGWVGGPRGIVFITLHQVSSLHQVSAKCTHAHEAGALNGS